MKPGIRTSEFWLALLAEIAGGLQMYLPDTHWSAKLAGGIVAGLAAMGYAASRGMAKQAAAE